MPSTSLLTEYLASLNKQLANARKRHLATFSAVKAASEMDKKLASFSLRSSQQRITKTEKSPAIPYRLRGSWYARQDSNL